MRQARDRCRRVVLTHGRARAARGSRPLRSRPVLATPATLVDVRRARGASTCATAPGAAPAPGSTPQSPTSRTSCARVVALSPQATLDRGYAVVQDEDGAVVRDADAVEPGSDLQVRLAKGTLLVTAD